jgi:PAS domain S-box-containing protein
VNIKRDGTERRQAPDARWASSQRIQSILESITDAFVAVDREWVYTYINERALRHMRQRKNQELPREAFLGKNMWEMFPEAVGTSIYASYHEAMRERKTVEFETYFPPSHEWIEAHVYPWDGGLAIYYRDITGRKLEEEKLRRSEAYLAEGQRLTRTGSWAWNVSTGDLFWSEEHFRICGMDPEKEQPSSAAMKWIHADDRSFVQERFEKAINERTGFELDCRVVWTDGTIRYVHSFAHPVFYEARDLTEYVGTILDMTERKQEEEARSSLVRRLFAAQEEERGRISRELHDDFGQHVSALALRLTAITREYGEHTNLGLQLGSLETIVKQLGSDINVIAWQLRPAALDDFGLVSALGSHIARWSEHVDVRTELHVDGIEANLLTDEHKTALYRIVQEALNNVAKHARARNVVVLLQRRADDVWLTVEDDGAGFDTEQVLPARDRRLGVVGMRERASLLGGTLDVESKPGQGTTVVARIPAVASS